MTDENGKSNRICWICFSIAGIVAIGSTALYLTRPSPAPLAAEETAPATAVAPEAKNPVIPQVPLPLPPLTRSDLLAATAKAADAAAGGGEAPKESQNLVGRSFSIRLPFGCDGPLDENAKDWAGWTFNAKTRALKLVARPEDWGLAEWTRALAGDTPFDAIEGFWLKRPWTSSEACPATPRTGIPAIPVSPPHETVGVAQFFTPDSPRTLQRGSRPYSLTLKAEKEISDAPREYHLVVSGKIAAYADGRPIHCWVETGAVPPVCVIKVEFGEIAFQGPDGAILTSWR